MQRLGLVKDVWKSWSNIIKGRALYQSMILRLSGTCLGQRVHSRPLSSLVPQCPVSHRNACELSLMEEMVRMADNGMGCSMYQCVRFPRFAKNMVNLVRCNMCRIMCEALESTFIPCHDTLALQKGLVYRGI